jgi:hypothetical protein
MKDEQNIVKEKEEEDDDDDDALSQTYVSFKLTHFSNNCNDVHE